MPDATSTCPGTKELASSHLTACIDMCVLLHKELYFKRQRSTTADKLVVITSFSPRYVFVFGCIDLIINASVHAQRGYSSPSACPLCVGYHSSCPSVQLSHASLESKSYLEGCLFTNFARSALFESRLPLQSTPP